MARNLINKYLWILETIERHGSILRTDLNHLWQNSSVSGGEPLARRTFYNYRNGIEELFGIKIGYNASTYEYFIEESSDSAVIFNSWLINSLSINGMLSDASAIAERVMLEEVPSARQHLPVIIDAIKASRKLRIDYRPFYRVSSTDGIIIEPYFLRIFRQRWYVIGYNTKDRKIKTYSLDRIGEATLTDEHFDMPDINVKDFFKNFFGITTSMSEPKRVVIRTDSEQAKYLRALPLHASQSETVCEGYSLFHYNICITLDFLQELLSFGQRITVISPPELKAMIVEELKASLSHYDNL